MLKVVAPLMTLAVLLSLGSTLKPQKAAGATLADTGCKVKDHQQVCLATLKHFERSSKGWKLYLEGEKIYTITASRLPKNQVNKRLEITLETTPMGWSLINWEAKY